MANPNNALQKVTAHINQTIADNDGKDTTVSLSFGHKKINIGKITPEIKTVIEQCPYVDFLQLAETNLTSLDHLPNFELLDTLDLLNNNLTDEEILKIAQYKKLNNLYIEGNKIEKVETLEQLAELLPGLKTLEIDKNPVVNVPNFKSRVWNAFKNLDVLNHEYRDGTKLAY